MDQFEFFKELDSQYRSEKDVVEARLLSVVRFLPFLSGISAYLFTQKVRPVACCTGTPDWYNLLLALNVSLLILCTAAAIYCYLRPSKVSFFADVPVLHNYWKELDEYNQGLSEDCPTTSLAEGLLPRMIENAAFNETSFLSDLRKLNMVRYAFLATITSYLPLIIVLFFRV